MKVHGAITIAGTAYQPGDEVPWTRVYPFFLLHMGIFGASGFLMAYADKPAPLPFLFVHGGFAIAIYLVFYLAMFGRDEVKWMLVNAGLGLFGIYTEIGWLLGLFGKDPSQYSWVRHAIPFGYFVLYTFLLRHMVLDIAGARDDEVRRGRVEQAYVWGSLLVYTGLWVLHQVRAA